MMHGEVGADAHQWQLARSLHVLIHNNRIRVSTVVSARGVMIGFYMDPFAGFSSNVRVPAWVGGELAVEGGSQELRA